MGAMHPGRELCFDVGDDEQGLFGRFLKFVGESRMAGDLRLSPEAG